MLQVAGDLRLQDEPRPLVGPLGESVLDHLQRHLPLQLAVPRHPDLPDPSLCMRPDRPEAFADGRRTGHPRVGRRPAPGKAIVSPTPSVLPIRRERRVQADRHPERRPQGRFADLRQDLLGQPLGIPRIQAGTDIVLMAGEVGFGQAMEGLEAIAIDGAVAEQELGEAQVPVPGPVLRATDSA